MRRCETPLRRCEHGFAACYSCRLEYVHPTLCHVPGCEDRKTEGQKFCPKHGGKAAAHYFALPLEDRNSEEND